MTTATKPRSSAECEKSAKPAPTTLSASTRSEESDNYPEVVAVLNPTLRVIRGKCGLQWIAQRKNRPARWSNPAFCATKESLLLRIRDYLRHLNNPNERTPLETLASLYCNPEPWHNVMELPEFYPKRIAPHFVKFEEFPAGPLAQKVLADA